MTDPLSSSRYCIERAQTHINDLEAGLVAFKESHPYAQVHESNAHGLFDSHKIKLVKPFPRAAPGLAFDAANNMRSALDQAGFVVAVGFKKAGHNAHFPFGESREAASRCNDGHGRSRDIPQELFITMMSFEPYKGGNNLLWGLNNLCNTNKHEAVVQVFPFTGLAMVRGKKYDGIPLAGPPIWDTLKNEMEIARVPRGSTDKVEFRGQMEVVLADIEGVRNKPTVPTLRAMCAEVERCLATIEDRARHFGFVT